MESRDDLERQGGSSFATPAPVAAGGAVLSSSVLVKSPEVVSRKIDQESIIVPIRQSASDLQCIYSLEGIAAEVWDLIDGKRTVGEIVDGVVSEYDVSVERARTDIEEFVSSLVDVGCVTWQSPNLKE